MTDAMREMGRQWRAGAGDVDSAPEIPDDLRKKLEALGYTG